MNTSLIRSQIKRVTWTVCFISLLLSAESPFAQISEHEKVQKVIIDFFDALAALNDQGIRDVVENDFILLEDGEVWNTDTLINALTPVKSRKFSRINHLKFFSTEQQGDVAWVSYDNKADITVDDKPYKRHWLESAVLKRKNGRWKISLLHSTVIRNRQH